MKNVIKPIMVSTFLALSLGACSAATEQADVTQKVKTNHSTPGVAPTGYSKPSAAIDFQHDFSGRSTVGATQIVTMKVMDRYPGGTVDISVMPSEGVTVFKNNTQRSFKMGGNENEFQLQFQANSEGVHRINVLAKATLSDGQVINRSYSMPIYVGDQFQPTKGSTKNRDLNDANRQLQKESSSGLIVMEAEETITTSD